MPKLSVLSTNPKPTKNFNLVYQLKTNRKWVFVGYICNNCQSIIKNDNTVPRHELKCKKRIEPIEPITILTNKRQLWKTIEMNQ